MPFRETQNTPLRVKKTREASSACKYASTPSRLFESTISSVKKAEEAKKIKERAREKQHRMALERKILIEAQKKEQRQKNEEEQEIARSNLDEWKQQAEAEARDACKAKETERKRKRNELLLSDQHKCARKSVKLRETCDTLEVNRENSEAISSFRQKEKLARRMSMVNRREVAQQQDLFLQKQDEQRLRSEQQQHKLKEQDAADVSNYQKKLKEDKRK